jgi:thiol-disulfide isomerase/thioredoxin
MRGGGVGTWVEWLRWTVGTWVVVAVVVWPLPVTAQQEPGNPIRTEFRTIEDRTIALDELRGRVVLLDFWATWCAPCLAELPRLKKLRAAYDRADFEIIGISLDSLDRRTFTSWVRRNNITWPQVLEGRSYNGDLARAFNVEKLPVTILIDRAGRLAGRDLRGPRLEAAIRRYIAQSTSASPTPEPPRR